MVTKEKMDLLKDRYLNAKTESEREAVRMEIRHLCDDDAEAVALLATRQMEDTIREVDEAVVRQQMEEILPLMSVAYIAKTYFNKSRQWLYQRINGHIVNGKPARFTAQEIDVLNSALQDMGKKLLSTHISYKS